MFKKVVKCKPDIMPLIFSNQFFEKRLSFRERNMKLLLETVTYIRVTCIITMKTGTYIMQCRKYYLHNCNSNSHLHNYNKNCHPHICRRNCQLHMCYRNFLWHNCNRNSIIVTERSTSIKVTASTTSKPTKMQQTLPLA